MKSARVITTFDCNRSCPYCVNNYESVISQAVEKDNLDFVKDYDEIILTGGEPLLYPEQIIDLIYRIKEINSDVIIYLYTAKWDPLLQTILYIIDGLTYSLHENYNFKDIEDFNAVEQMITYNPDNNFRLFVHKNNEISISIRPYLWDRIKIEGTLEEGECEYLEDELIILKEWGDSA